MPRKASTKGASAQGLTAAPATEQVADTTAAAAFDASKPKEVIIVTTSVNAKEACTYNGVVNGLLGAPPENAAERAKIAKVIVFIAVPALKDVAAALTPQTVLVVLDLDTIAGQHRTVNAVFAAVRRALKALGLSKVAAVHMTASGRITQVPVGRILDRRHHEFSEHITALGMTVYPDAEARRTKYNA